MDPASSESELLRRWQDEQDPEALDQLLRREIRFLKERLEQPSTAGRPSAASRDDVAQEAVLRFLAADPAPRFPTRAALHAYLWKTARNLLVDRLRRARVGFLEIRATETAGLSHEPETRGSLDRIERQDMAAALELALHVQKPADQAILRAVYLRGASIDDAARELGISRDVANTRLVRARLRLAEKLAEWRDLVSG